MRPAPSQSTPRSGASFVRPVFPRKNSRLRAKEFFSAAAGWRCRKEVAQMKKDMKPLLSILLLTGVLGLGTAGAGAEGIVSQGPLGRSGDFPFEVSRDPGKDARLGAPRFEGSRFGRPHRFLRTVRPRPARKRGGLEAKARPQIPDDDRPGMTLTGRVHVAGAIRRQGFGI